MKKFDVVWKAKRGGIVRFSDINVPAVDAESAVAAVKAKHGAMFQELVSVNPYVPPSPETFAGLHHRLEQIAVEGGWRSQGD